MSGPITQMHDCTNYSGSEEDCILAESGASSSPRSLSVSSIRSGTITSPRISVESIRSACLLSLDETAPTNLCYMIPRTTPRSEANALEYAWGIPPRDLNLDNSRNLISLRADYGRAFDNHDWVMVPLLHDLIMAMVAACSGRHYLEVFPSKEYEYTLVHLKGHPVRINREQVPLVLPYEAEFQPYETYYTPYHDFPPLRSQVHPYFAIFKAGKAAEALTEDERTEFEASVSNLEDNSSVASRLELCRIILGLWIPNPPAPSISIPRSVSSEHSTTVGSQPNRHGTPSGSRRAGMNGGPCPSRNEPQDTRSLASPIQDCLVVSEEPMHKSVSGHDAVNVLAIENLDAGSQPDIVHWAKNVGSYAADELII